MPQLVISTVQILAWGQHQVESEVDTHVIEAADGGRFGPAHPLAVRAAAVKAWMLDELEAFADLYDEDGATSAERLAEEAAQHFGVYEEGGAIPEYVWAAAAEVAGGGQ